MHLGKLASQCSSLGRVRILALIVKLFSVSHQVASVVSKSNLLRLFEADIGSNDTLATLNVMELLYELSEIKHGRVFLSSSTFLQLLTSIISNQSTDSILRSRVMIISGRLLSNGNYILSDGSSAKTVVSAIDRILDSSESHDTDECETALEALGQIGSSMEGAQLLLSSSPPAARHVIYFAFDRQGHGRQLAALHALANISGETRSENSVILSGEAFSGMEARFNCCKTIHAAFYMTSKLSSDPALGGIAAKVSRLICGTFMWKRYYGSIASLPWPVRPDTYYQ